MLVNDPVSDMLTRIRNGLTAKHEYVDIPKSKQKIAVANILLEEGYVSAVEVIGKGDYNDVIRVTLKYVNGVKAITGLKRISKPGLRIYANCEDLPVVLNGLGIAIISTNKGIVTDKVARSLNVGGEVMAYVW